MTGLEVITRIDVAPDVSAPIDEVLLSEAVKSALDVAAARAPSWLIGAGLPLEVSLRITNNSQMQELNRDYRGVDRPTDVLSFSFVEDEQAAQQMIAAGSPVQLGEVFLSYEYCERQAEELGHSIYAELAWLTIHGTLQLVGFAHETDAEAEEMEALEMTALKALGIEVS
jgi:probable rRNA maturation factor